jgi:hypothetical protein
MTTPTLPTMPSTDDQDPNQELNAGLANTPANTTPDAPMISPDFSDTRVVPFAQQKAATDAGWQPATKMTHPDTQDKRWVPNTQVNDAKKSGYVETAASTTVPAASTPSQPFQGLGSAAADMAKGVTMTGALGAAKNLFDSVTEDIPATYKAYEAARQSGKSPMESVSAASDKAKEIADAKNPFVQATKAFAENPNKAAWSAVLELAVPLIGGGMPEVAETAPTVAEGVTPGVAPAEDAVTHVYTPGGGLQAVKRMVSPEAATQPEAQSAFRTGAQASAEDAGVTGEASKGGIRTLMDKPIRQASAVERNLYDTVNDAAETDMKSLYDRREELQDTLDDPTQIANKTALQKELTSTQASIDTGEAKVQDRLGTKASDLLQKAKAATQQRFAMEQGDAKLFNNESVVNGNAENGADETINVKAAIRNAEQLDKPSKFAPRGTPTRLQQMFGEEGAKAFKQGLYDAKASGTTVATRNTVLKWLGGVGGVGLGGFEAFTHLK